jgi:hypothetical protein
MILDRRPDHLALLLSPHHRAFITDDGTRVVLAAAAGSVTVT